MAIRLYATHDRLSTDGQDGNEGTEPDMKSQRNMRGRRIAKRLMAAFVAIALGPLAFAMTPQVAMADGSDGITKLPAACFDATTSHIKTQTGGSGIIEKATFKLVGYFFDLLVNKIVNEKDKAKRVQNTLDKLRYCFPNYNVLISQSHEGNTQDLRGTLLKTTANISGTTYNIYVFKSGTVHQEGDLGYKNWAYGGWFSVSDDHRTVTFSEPPAPQRDANWNEDKGATQCEVVGRNLPDRNYYYNTFDPIGDSGKDATATAVRMLVDDFRRCFPDYNVMVMHREQPSHWQSQPEREVYSGTYYLHDKDSEDKSGTLTLPIKQGRGYYDVHVFKKGTFVNDGDGGWFNWAYFGNYAQSGTDGKTVSFDDPGTADLEAGVRNDSGESHFDDGNPQFADHDDTHPYPGCSYNGDKPKGRDKLIQSLVTEYQRCNANANILVTHNVNSLTFNNVSGLRHLASVNGNDVYALDSGTVLNNGDGGWINWGFSGQFTQDDRIVEFRRGGATDAGSGSDSGSDGDGNANPDTRRSGSIQWNEVDADNVNHWLKDAEWRLTKADGGEVTGTDGVNKTDIKDMYAPYEGSESSGQNDGNEGAGRFKVSNLPWGDYKLTQTKAPTGFREGAMPTFTLTIDADHTDVWLNADHDGKVTDTRQPDGDGDSGNTGDSGNSGSTGGSSGDPVDPNFSGETSTFTVNANDTSFSVTQPKNSVATYVWEDGQQPREWITTANGAGMDYRLSPVNVKVNGNSSSTISVDQGRTYQTIDGFGAALTDSAAALIEGSPQQDRILSDLFGTGEGQAGLNIVRAPMGSTDLMADPNDVHTFEDSKGSFSVDAHDSDRRQIDMLQKIKGKTGDFKLLGVPWTTPGWAKKSGELTASSCGNDRNEFDVTKIGDYADYFRKYVDAYGAKGIRPWMVSLQNEPENCKTGMPTATFTAQDEVALSNAVRNALPGDVKVMGWDHNWNDPDFVNTLTSSGKVDAIGYHCYDGTNYGSQTGARDTYMTECSGWTGDGATDVAGNMGWEVANTIIGPLRNGSKGSIYWSMAQRSDGSPWLDRDGTCRNCRGMVTVDGDSYQPSQDFYFWGQFGRFVRPGSVRVESSNSGDLSTVAFRNGNKTILVVLNSGTHADGGQPGSSSANLTNHIVQWDGDSSQQKAAWLVGADGYRRWISDGSTYNCLKYDAGKEGPDSVSSGSLDRYVNLQDVWAVCGTGLMGVNSELETGTYLKSGNGARLSLSRDGHLYATDSQGHETWSIESVGVRFILQPDGNLVLYDANGHATWASNTVGSGAKWLFIRDEGSFALSDANDKVVWESASANPDDYKGKIVQWSGDTASQKTSWYVGADGHRRWIHDWETFQCLHDAGAGDSRSVSDAVLDKLPDLNGVWATCGADRIGPNGALDTGSYLKAGDYTLVMQPDGNLVEYDRDHHPIWATATDKQGGIQTILQPDGNLVMYDRDRHPLWASHTDGRKPGWLVLGDDGSLRLYDGDNNEIWHR